MAEDYEVTQQREVIDLATDGQPVRSQEITFKSLPSGTVATVRIPIADLSAQSAKTAIEARRNTIEDVHAL